MDYEIFLLTRIRERFLQTGDTRDAVAYGVSTSARTITSAALIMIAVFIGFAFAGMPLVAELGVACAVAIAVTPPSCAWSWCRRDGDVRPVELVAAAVAGPAAAGGRLRSRCPRWTSATS